MSLLPASFDEKAQAAVRMLATTEVAEPVTKEVDAFFGRYPDLNRTRLTEAFITALVIERFADSVPPTQPQSKTA